MLLIYLQALTPRTEYIFDLVFKNELGISYTITTNRHAFERYGQEKLNYSCTRSDKDFFIYSSTLLFKKSIEEINIPVEKKYEFVVLFPNDASCDMGFDIFAAIFYMVSRYEEYLPFKPDKHGRFKASDSFAYQNNFLQFPVVNTWIQDFKKKLSEKFPLLQFQSGSFKAIVTYDIDLGYAFKGRSSFRFAAGSAKDILTLNFRNLLNRFSGLSGNKDPWDVYDSLKETLVKNKLRSVFFFLLGEYSTYNKNINFDHPLMADLINNIAAFSDIGIHPSYESSENPGKILIEKSRLEKISGKKIIKSRQHYLRLKLPDTYNELLKTGVTQDYSMGFADMPGFRAGICTPFYFYDLRNEKQTTLLLYPVTIMDGNFMKYLKKKPAESIQIIFRLIDHVKNVKGTFISIWHNHTLSNDHKNKGWREVHEAMIEKLVDNESTVVS
ncbi:MAG TPA: polysaccharide deacetylase family protein [Chitinophagaceae bacterium]|nr:polysaccharide deacetylase family protein [Chitinophagaceae bacterium]